MSEKLLSCPICFGQATVGQAASDRLWYAGCLRENCDAATVSAMSAARAIAAWNTQANNEKGA